MEAEEAGTDACQVCGGPTCCDFLGKGTIVAFAMGEEFNLIMKTVDKMGWIVKEITINREKNRSKDGRVAAGSRVIVIGGCHHDNISVVGLLDDTVKQLPTW